MSNFHWCTLFLNYALPPILYIINAIGESIIRFLKKKKKEKNPYPSCFIGKFSFRYRRIQILIDTGKDLTLINFKSRRFENSSRVFELASWLLAVTRSYLLDDVANDDRFISILYHEGGLGHRLFPILSNNTLHVSVIILQSFIKEESIERIWLNRIPILYSFLYYSKYINPKKISRLLQT